MCSSDFYTPKMEKDPSTADKLHHMIFLNIRLIFPKIKDISVVICGFTFNTNHTLHAHARSFVLAHMTFSKEIVSSFAQIYFQ